MACRIFISKPFGAVSCFSERLRFPVTLNMIDEGLDALINFKSNIDLGLVIRYLRNDFCRLS